MKAPNNIFLCSLLILIIMLIVLVAADIIAVELLAIPYLHPVFQFLIPLVLIFIFSKGKVGDYGLKLPDRIPYILIILWVVIIHIVLEIPLLLFQVKEESNLLSNDSSWKILLQGWILAPFAEEMITRGLGQSFLSPFKHIGIKVKEVYFSYPVIFIALVFSLVHLPPIIRRGDIVGGITLLFGAFSFGILLGYVREKTGSIVPAIIGHMLANIIATIIGFIPFK